MTQGKDIISERYQQENPEGARLVSEEVRSAAGKSEPAKAAQKRRKTSEPVTEAKSAKEPSKKTAAGSRKTSKKSAAKKQEPATEETPSVKTPSVMKLVEDSPLTENQVIAAGKSRIPRQLRGIEPLSRVIRREAAEMSEAERVNSSPVVSRDLTEMVIVQNAPGVLRRFNACDCEVCRGELSRLAAEEIPARYVKLPELADLDYNGFSKEERLLIQSLTKTAVSVMIRLMMINKKRNFHE